jgi:hypothetical protein
MSLRIVAPRTSACAAERVGERLPDARFVARFRPAPFFATAFRAVVFRAAFLVAGLLARRRAALFFAMAADSSRIPDSGIRNQGGARDQTDPIPCPAPIPDT